MKKISNRQARILCILWQVGRCRHPRHTLERLAEKGLAEGDRRGGWALTQAGRDEVVQMFSSGPASEVWARIYSEEDELRALPDDSEGGASV